MLWGCGVEMMWGCGSQPVALPPSLGSHTHSNILDWSCSIWFFPPYAKTHLHSFILRSGKAFLIDLNNVIFSNSHINQFCRREKKTSKSCPNKFLNMSVTKRFNFFKISQLFWRDFVFWSLKYFRFGPCKFHWFSNFYCFTPNRSLGDDGATNNHRHCHKLQTAVTCVLDDLERNKKRKIV